MNEPRVFRPEPPLPTVGWVCEIGGTWHIRASFKAACDVAIEWWVKRRENGERSN